MMRVLVLVTAAAGVANAFSVGSRSYAGRATARSVRRGPIMAGQPAPEQSVTTRRALFLPAAGAALGWGVAAHPAAALVKGSAPPPKKEKREKRTCTTIDECEEVGRQREGKWGGASRPTSVSARRPSAGSLTTSTHFSPVDPQRRCSTRTT